MWWHLIFLIISDHVPLLILKALLGTNPSFTLLLFFSLWGSDGGQCLGFSHGRLIMMFWLTDTAGWSAAWNPLLVFYLVQWKPYYWKTALRRDHPSFKNTSEDFALIHVLPCNWIPTTFLWGLSSFFLRVVLKKGFHCHDNSFPELVTGRGKGAPSLPVSLASAHWHVCLHFLLPLIYYEASKNWCLVLH